MAVADEVISIARQQIGKPYKFGSVGPNTFDCSGLVVYAFKHAANMNLPHYTGSLIFRGTEVSKSQLAPGDLVFPDAGHVQIYSGNGMVIEAPHTGANVREVKMWGFWRARRLVAPGTATPAAGGTVTTVNNPLVPDGVENLINAYNTIGNKVTSGPFWRDIALYAMGTILLIAGFLLLMTEETSVGKIAKAVVK